MTRADRSLFYRLRGNPPAASVLRKWDAYLETECFVPNGDSHEKALRLIKLFVNKDFHVYMRNYITWAFYYNCDGIAYGEFLTYKD